LCRLRAKFVHGSGDETPAEIQSFSLRRLNDSPPLSCTYEMSGRHRHTEPLAHNLENEGVPALLRRVTHDAYPALRNSECIDECVECAAVE
jgi:hypothetical protein